MTSKSKTKGNAFERELAKMLNQTFNTTEFARTPGSGAFMGRSNFAKKSGLSQEVKDTLSSDIIVPTWFPFSVEAKSYADDPNYSQIIRGRDSKLHQWLSECVYDANNFSMIPLLFFKTSRKGTYFAVPSFFEEILESDYCLRYEQFVIYGVETFTENKDKILDNLITLKNSNLIWLKTDYARSLIEHIANQIGKTRTSK